MRRLGGGRRESESNNIYKYQNIIILIRSRCVSIGSNGRVEVEASADGLIGRVGGGSWIRGSGEWVEFAYERT